jgi:hypothetical protein
VRFVEPLASSFREGLLFARHWFGPALVGLGGFSLVFWGVPLHEQWRMSSIAPTPADTVAGASSHTSGGQLRLIYFGKQSCPWCQKLETKEVVRSAKAHLSSEARLRGLSFNTAGVGLDWAAADGIGYIMSVGAFDEVSGGYGWANEWTRRFLWGDMAGKAAVPQVVVTVRRLLAPDSLDSPSYEFGEEILVDRFVGLEELTEWASKGFPLNTHLIDSVARSAQ